VFRCEIDVTDASDGYRERISADGRAYAAVLIVLLPLIGLFSAVALTSHTLGAGPFIGVAAVGLLWCGALSNRMVVFDETGLAQGWPPFQRRLAYAEVVGVHHVFPSGRGAAGVCLAISTQSSRTPILVPLKSFSVAKRQRLVEILRLRAPQARFEVSA
jgi:hypothetical protein